MSLFDEIDEELYQHERPWWRYQASGFPVRFALPSYRERWTARRDHLERVLELVSSRGCPMGRNHWLQRATDGR